MHAELVKLQKSAASFTDSLQTTLQSSASQIQSQMPQIHQSYADLNAALSSTATELGSIITNQDLPLQERLGRVSKEVCERIQPLLESMKNGVSKVLARSQPPQVDSRGNGVNGRGQ
jgi:hypothetical protein